MNKLQIAYASLLCSVAVWNMPMRTATAADMLACALKGQNQGATPGRGHRGPPPQASFHACASKAVNDACAFQDNGHALEGTCAAPPPDERHAACMQAGLARTVSRAAVSLPLVLRRSTHPDVCALWCRAVSGYCTT